MLRGGVAKSVARLDNLPRCLQVGGLGFKSRQRSLICKYLDLNGNHTLRVKCYKLLKFESKSWRITGKYQIAVAVLYRLHCVGRNLEFVPAVMTNIDIILLVKSLHINLLL